MKGFLHDTIQIILLTIKMGLRFSLISEDETLRMELFFDSFIEVYRVTDEGRRFKTVDDIIALKVIFSEHGPYM